MSRDEQRRRRPALAFFAVLLLGLIAGSTVVVTRISGQIETTSREYEAQANRVTTMNYVHREAMMWRAQLASLETTLRFKDLEVRRALLKRQMDVVSTLADDSVERDTMAQVRTELRKIDPVVDRLSPASSTTEFAKAWLLIDEPLVSLIANLKQLYHHSEAAFVSMVADASRRSRQSRMHLGALGILLLALGGSFALMLRRAIRADFRVAYLALQEEMAERESAEQALAAREARFRSLVQRSSDMVTVWDAQGSVIYESDSVERLLGWGQQSRFGADAVSFVHPDDRPAFRRIMERDLGEPGATSTLELRQQHADGNWRWVELTCANLTDEPSVAGFVANYRLIEERRALQERLEYQARYDILTGLANRAVFRDRVAMVLDGGREPGHAALLFIDLDDFKSVNDDLGHAAGDELLIAVGSRLRECVRPGDLVARLGGDEFAILLERLDPESPTAETIAQRVAEALDSPISIGGRTVFVRASVGIAAADEGVDAETLVQNADIAMYEAKAAGKGRYELFSDEMRQHVQHRVSLVADLREAIQEQQFVLHYQPVIDLESGRVKSVEALIRWLHPTRGMIPPAEFIDLAEESGDIVPIGRWVVEQACRQLAAWRLQYPAHDDLKVAINLSSAQLRSDGMIEAVSEALWSHGLRPDSLIVEVTESVLSQDVDVVAERIQQLSTLGVAIAVDDFGTGYSSLSHLQRFPVSMLKVDRSFVQPVGTGSAEDTALAKAIVRLGQTLGLEVVAEGVETTEQEQWLRGVGCHSGQGYYFARPADPDALAEILSQPIPDTASTIASQTNVPVPPGPSDARPRSRASAA